jgi:c-di-GMP-binding flagellar brake protein YcgR
MLGRRRYERMPFFCPVTVSVLPDGPALSGRTFDISLGGVGITAQRMLERGKTVRVRFHIQNGSDVAVDEEVMGRVAYSRADEDGDRAGIEFLQAVNDSMQPMLAYKLNNL